MIHPGNTLEFWGTSANKQSMQGLIETTVDPTSVPPAFGITKQLDTDGPSVWVNGAWASSWDTSTHKALAVTPTIGLTAAAPSLVIAAAGTVYKVWAKVTVGAEVWTEPVFELRVPA